MQVIQLKNNCHRNAKYGIFPTIGHAILRPYVLYQINIVSTSLLLTYYNTDWSPASRTSDYTDVSEN